MAQAALQEWYTETDPVLDAIGSVLGTRANNFLAGFGDTVTCNGTQKIRVLMGTDDTVDKTSSAYANGRTTGKAYNVVMTVACPAGAAGAFQQAINGAAMASQAIDAADAADHGDYTGVAMLGLGVLTSSLHGSGSPCGNGLAYGMQVLGAAQGIGSAIGNFRGGHIADGILDIAQAGANTYQFFQSCFAAGTPLLTPTGSKPIEEFRPGDLLLSRSEFDPDGPVEARAVEEVFARSARIKALHVGGRVIRTTAEHPFYVHGRGWVAASQLGIGDLLVGHSCQSSPVQDIVDTGQWVPVYNLRVQDYHTYFVGAAEWGFSVWAHNAGQSHQNATAIIRVSN